MSGYARLHRDLIGHPAFRNDGEAMAFAYMVLRAAWRETRVRYKGKSITLRRAQLAMSVRDLAESLDRDKGWVERLLKRLRSETMIETASETGVLVVTICNYDKYQAANDERETPDKTLDETDARQTQDTEQRREEDKKERSSEDDLVPLPDEDRGGEPPLTADEVLEAWNATAAKCGLPKAKLTSQRRKKLAPLIRRHSIADFTEAIRAIERSPFLRGENNRAWRANFDFFLQPSSFTRLIEGNYDRPTH